MEKGLIVKQTIDHIKSQLMNEPTGHDFYHAIRVFRTARRIAKRERADLYIVELASLLHDISDWKFNNGDENLGSKTAEEWLKSLGVESEVWVKVAGIIKDISFKGAGVPVKELSKEGQVVQDADRLDALGAMGIARAFAYGGFCGNPIYDPEMKPNIHQSFEEYKKSKGTTINHFYEKLLLLKDLMNTKKGRKLAVKRHRFLKKYLKRFFREWNGRD